MRHPEIRAKLRRSRTRAVTLYMAVLDLVETVPMAVGNSFFPFFIVNDEPNRVWPHAVSLGKYLQTKLTSGVLGPYFFGLLQGQLGRMVALMEQGSAFFDHVFRVLGRIADPKMIWIHTRRVVTRVANQFMWRDRSVVPLIRQAMGSAIDIVYGEPSISVLVFVGRPNPAVLSFQNLFKKSLLWRFIRGHVGAIPHGSV